MIASDFPRLLKGYGLTTAEIMYRMPDHPALLQTFVWQQYDEAPEFPMLHDFLDFWRREIEGPLHSVKVAYRHMVSPTRWRTVEGIAVLH